MAIGTATAIIGASVIGAGTSLAASKTAAKAANNAADANAAVQRDIYNQTRTDLKPYNEAGTTALSALQQKLGLTGGAPAPSGIVTGAPAPTQTPAINYGTPEGGAASVPAAANTNAGGSPNWQAYLQANPDVAQEFARTSQSDLAGQGISTPEQYAQYHYTNYGQNEGRALPTADAGATAGQSFAPSTVAGEPTFTRPTDIAAPTYTRGADLNAPDYASFFGNFKEDPGYQYRLSQGLNAVNTASAARGKLRSGDAAMALQERGDGLASQGYNDWFQRQQQLYANANNAYQYAQGRNDNIFADDRAYGTSVWGTQQQRQDNNFADDRAYGTGRYDQGVSNLFGLVGVGQNAAAGTANAGNVFAQGQTSSNNQRADAIGNSAIAGANSVNGLIGSGLQAYGYSQGKKGVY